MNFLLWLLLGGIAGWIASKITKTDASMGVLANIIVGIVGAFIGGLLFNFMGSQDVNGFNLYSLLVATVGSVVLLTIIKMIRRP